MNNNYSWINNYKLLTAKEEQELGRKACKGDKKAQSRIINANYRLVLKIANEFVKKSPNLELDDLFQEGVIGLKRAAEMFDPDQFNNRFSTYASLWIKNFMRRHMFDMGMDIKIPANHRELFNDFKFNMARLNDTLGDDSDSELLDMIEDQNAENPETAAVNAMLRRDMMSAVSNLSPVEQKVICRRFGLGKRAPQSLSEIGEEMGYSKERIRQLECRGIYNLRKYIEKFGYDAA